MTKHREREHADTLKLSSSAAGIAAFRWDISSDDPTWSPHMVNLLCIPADIEASFTSFGTFLHPEDRTMISAAVSPPIETHKDDVSRVRIKHREGEERILLGR
jgi:hypothetical protein